MKMLLLAAAAAAACLSACQSLPDGRASEAVTIAAEAAETSTRLRCPRTALELAILVSVRIGFDQSAGRDLNDAQRARVDAARAKTNRACGFAQAPASTPADTAKEA